jgi:hypothetical protein
MQGSELEERAEELVAAVRTYMEQTASAHACVGWSCKHCAMDGDRAVELKGDFMSVMQSWKEVAPRF